ncbi:zinc-finger homeodomain protein 11-like [Tasmannia lanceolata]|uniref:zinc-finger homeodomain protein 11-like n=1 Tax=Tasmannia lanceolata TaxID=3420 RepID=UPI0040645C92
MNSENLNEEYRECLRNHAANLGSYATDGCGEYTPTSAGLTCAACGCHRNFHRKVIIGGSETTTPVSFESTESDRGGKIRIRTRFSAEQKDKMMGFAEKIGWKIQRKEQEEEIERFCNEVGVSRQAFKIWIHNHKNSSSSSSSPNNAS